MTDSTAVIGSSGRRRLEAGWLSLRIERLRRELERFISRERPEDEDERESVAAIEARIADLDTRLREQAIAMTGSGSAPALLRVVETFGLSSFEENLLVLCVGAELDPWIARVCATLHGDDRMSWPSLALALDLFVADPAEQVLALDALMPAAPLARFRLVRRDDSGPRSPLERRLFLDQRVTDHIRGVDLPDPTVASLLHWPASLLLTDAQNALAHAIATSVGDSAEWPTVNLVGSADSGAFDVAVEACRRIGMRCLELDLGAVLTSGVERTELFAVLEREAALARLAYAIEPDGVSEADRDAWQSLTCDIVERLSAAVFVVSAERFPGRRPMVVVPVARPSRPDQQRLWHAALADVPNSVNGEIARIVQQFDLGPRAIRDTVLLAGRSSGIRTAGNGSGVVTGSELWAACRERSVVALDDLAQRIEPGHRWDDIVLPSDALAQLREIADQVEQRPVVYEEWEFAAGLTRGRGISALFAGASGTGKTMAAEILAAHLELDLFAIDLAGVVSKYIGETEKNLKRLFDVAERSGAMLFFDEADALFGTRSEVRDSHDRYANIEINYLLQRMERYTGLAILATNRRTALDEAFLRRLRFVVDFPFPSVDDRRRIWELSFPSAARLDALDLTFLAGLELTGGSIRSIALNAAFLAAADGGVVRMSHVLKAVRREYAKHGRTVSSSEFGAYRAMVQA